MHATGAQPVGDRRQAFTRVGGVCRRFVPTYAPNGEVFFPWRICSLAPNGGSGMAGAVPKLLPCLFPGENFFTLHKIVLPVHALLVTALTHKLLELPVRDL